MIPQIREINFGQGTEADYATLHEATISFADMGERVITTQVRIDGDIAPEFDGWELEFKGERFVLPVKEPQAQKNNSTRNSLVDLTFYSWPIYQMKRYFFFETTTTATGTVMADKYKASVNLNLVNFVALFNRVLDYYFDGSIVADLATGSYGSAVASINLDYSYIWDVLQDFYTIFGVRWHIEYDSTNDIYYIKIGYPAPIIDDHEFEYGYRGGLLHFERQVQDDNIKNILLGRGGDKNVPYRYFKGVDPNNPGWAADPDAIPELANIYFDRIRDINFRNYVQGWKAKHYGDTYSPSRAQTDWAYAKGYNDEAFDPVEYVKNDESITKYGERWGAMDDNDEIYPTIQGIERDGFGRVDEVVAVSPIETDDIYALAEAAANIVSLHGVMSQVGYIAAHNSINKQLRGETFTIPAGQSANIQNNGFFATVNSPYAALVVANTSLSKIRVYNESTGIEVISGASGIPAGTYYYVVDITVENNSDYNLDNITFGVNGIDLVMSDSNPESWKPTFDIWVKNIWDTTQGQNESDEDYSLRVWGPILGDHLGNEAKVAFSDGFMSISEDYEFVIASYPVPDDSKVIGGYRSEWKITLYKSDAEFEISGLYIPNSTSGGTPVAGDHFFFLGIDLPNMYVTLAEERLNVYKTAALNQMKDVNPTWVIQFDKIRMNEAAPETQSFFDRIGTGTELRVKDVRFTGDEILRLFVNSITYTWHEPTESNPYILPDVEMVVSDRVVVEKSAVEKIQGDLDILKSTYAKMSDMEAVIQQVASPMFLRKTGESEVSLSPTKFASVVTSRDFRQGGVGGQGWGLYRDNSSIYQPEEQAAATRQTRAATPEQEPVTDSVMEVDKLVVRKEMHVNNLVVNQITHMGGKQITSAAAIECTQVVETPTSYVCYFDQRQGSVKNLFQVNDIAFGQVFEPDNTELRYYKMLVTAIDVDSITLAKAGQDGVGYPKKGDTIVQFGNTTNPDRQFVIIRDVIGGGYERMLSGLNSVSAPGMEYFFAGSNIPAGGGSPQARFFVGGADSAMEFSQQEGRLRIKGTIVQSSGGASNTDWPLTCYRGDYNSGTTYYYGDEITHTDGANYVYVNKTIPSTNRTPSDDGTYWKKRTDPGQGAKLVELVASSLFFAYANTSAPTPTGNTSITLTANVHNISSPTFIWSYRNGNSWSVISEQTGNTLTINHSDSRFSNNVLQIKVEISGETSLYDEVSIYKIYGGSNGNTPYIQGGYWYINGQSTGVKAEGEDGEDGVSPHIGDNGDWYIGDVDTNISASGEDAVTAFLSNTSHLFAAGENAAVSGSDSFSVFAFLGTKNLDFYNSGSSIITDGFTIGTISGNPTGMSVSKNSSTGVITVTVNSNLTQASGVLSIPVTIYITRNQTQTVSLKYSWALSFTGTGAKLISIDAEGLVFAYENTDASSPMNGTTIVLAAVKRNFNDTINWSYYSGSTKVSIGSGNSLTVYSGDTAGSAWASRWGAATSLRIVAEAANDSSLYDEVTIYKIYGGSEGESIYTAMVYKESESTPSTPSGTAVPPSGWSLTVPTGSQAAITPTYDSNIVTSGTPHIGSVGHGGAKWGKVTFSANAGDRVRVVVRASSESGYDYGYVSPLDSEAHSTTTFKAKISGTETATVDFDIPSTGTHFFCIGYVKDSSQTANDDTIYIDSVAKVGNPTIWFSTTIVTDGVGSGTWSAPQLMTGQNGQDGEDSITAFLTNTTHLFPAGEEEVESNIADTFEVKVFKGITPLSCGTGVEQFSIGTPVISPSTVTSQKMTAVANTSGGVQTGTVTVTAKAGLDVASGRVTIPISIRIDSSTTRTVDLVYSWALSFKGGQGPKGDAGARLRGPTVWNGISPYSSGENDEFQDIVYYVDNNGDGQYYLCINDVSAGSESNPNTNPKSDSNHWKQGSHFDFVASDLSVSLRSKIVDLNVNKLTTENVNNPKAIIRIAEDQMSISNPSGEDKIKITSGSLPEGGEASGSYALSSLSPAQSISPSSANESGSIEIDVGSITVNHENNRVAIPTLTFALSYLSTSINGGITANVSLWAGNFCLASHPLSAGRGATSHTVQDSARTVSLPVGSYTIKLIIDYTAAGTSPVSGSLAFTRGNTSRTITYPAEFTMIATDGAQFRYGSNGIRMTDDDVPKVIQGGNEYNMLAAELYNFPSGTAKPLRICFCKDNYPTEVSGVFYIKVSSN